MLLFWVRFKILGCADIFLHFLPFLFLMFLWVRTPLQLRDAVLNTQQLIFLILLIFKIRQQKFKI